MSRSEEHIVALHRRYALSRDRRLRDELLAEYDNFTVHLARTFSTRREDVEDLIQVARLGLIHALDRFDPDRERPFLSFARVTILGELKRHLRDHTWRLRTARILQEHYLLVVRTVDELTQESGRSPRISDVAARAGLSEDQVLEAMDVAKSAIPTSLDNCCREPHGPTIDPGAIDPGFGRFEDHRMLFQMIARLPEREQRIMRLRFEHELTQSQIAGQLGISQMAVSRILARTIRLLRVQLGIGLREPDRTCPAMEMPAAHEQARTPIPASRRS